MNTYFVIKNNYLGHIDLGTIMPFSFLVKSEKGVAQGTIAFSLFETKKFFISTFIFFVKKSNVEI